MINDSIMQYKMMDLKAEIDTIDLITTETSRQDPGPKHRR